GDKSMPATGPDVRAHPMGEPVGLELTAVALELQIHHARDHVDRFVLLDVVLQAQAVSGVDVDELPGVTLGDRPAHLVPPGLVDPAGPLRGDRTGLGGDLGHSEAPTAIRVLTPL